MNTANTARNRKTRALVAFSLVALGAALTAARMHGFSFSAWHAILDGSPPSEVLLNEPRSYRSDDWLVALPHCLAQQVVTPAFPVANPLIGDGRYNMIISGPAPVRDLTVAFRPQVWGYFISGDIGLAFQWWFGALGLWLAVWLVLLRLTGQDHWTSACGATALLFAPFFQAWSLNCAPSVIFACGTLLAILRLRTAGAVFQISPRSDLKNGRDGARPATLGIFSPGRDTLRRVRFFFQRQLQLILSAALLAWFGTALLLTFNYTPYLVTLLYFIIFVFAGMILTRPRPDANGAKIRSPTPYPSQEGIKDKTLETNEFPSLEGLGVGSTFWLSSPAGGSASSGNLVPFSPAALPRPHFHGLIGMRGAYALAALLLILGLGAYVISSNWDTIQLVQNSEYPGRRLATGGDQNIWQIFRGNVLSLKPPPDWRYLNPCEGAAFFLIFPLVIAALLRDWWRTRRPPGALLFGLAGYIGFLLIWNLAGFSETLAQGTLLSRAPAFRTLLGFGIADLFLLAVYVSTRRQTSAALRADRVTPWIVSALWISFHVALACKAAHYFPGYPLSTALTGGLFCMALAPLLYLAPRLVLPAMLAMSILTTYDINPLARGGTAFIRNNQLSRQILTLAQESRAQGRQPVWLVYGSLELPNLLRMLGVKALNGVQAYPQLELWRKLDPAGQSRTVYNRYAHVVFDLPADAEEVRFHLVQPDLFIVFLHPENPRFAVLDADYILCLDHQTAVLDRIPNLEKIYAYAGKHIYRVRQ